MPASVTVTIADAASDREACQAIRHAVFVIEQRVPAELEWDEWDRTATHFLARDIDGKAIGTARLIDDDGVAKIGRVAVLPEFRKRSIGRLVMSAALTEARRLGFSEVRIDAQTSVISFYEGLGFVAEGPEFEEASILHRRMRLAISDQRLPLM